MVENPILRLSAFVDCDSQSIIMRVPYSLAADMLKHCPSSPDKDELLKRVEIAARKSKSLRAALLAVKAI